MEIIEAKVIAINHTYVVEVMDLVEQKRYLKVLPQQFNPAMLDVIMSTMEEAPPETVRH